MTTENETHETAAEGVPIGTADDTGLQRWNYGLIVDTSGSVFDLVSGICGIADALHGPCFDDINDETAMRLCLALKRLTDRLYDAVYNNDVDLERKVRNAVEAPDSRGIVVGIVDGVMKCAAKYLIPAPLRLLAHASISATAPVISFLAWSAISA